MIAGIIAIIIIAAVIFFWDDFPKWIETAKKIGNDVSEAFKHDRNIRTKPKSQVTQKDISEIQRQQRERLEQQMKEAKRGFQEILDSKKQDVYGNELSRKLDEIQERLNAKHGTPNKTKSIKGMQITKWERDFLWEGISKRKRVPCIGCEKEDMAKGPNDGPSQKWFCPTCGQGVKLTFYNNDKNGFQCENLGRKAR